MPNIDARVRCILDSGAQATVISRALIDKSCLKWEKSPTRVFRFNQRSAKTYETACIHTLVNHLEIYREFLIPDLEDEEIIIGSDFHHKFDFLVNHRTGTVH